MRLNLLLTVCGILAIVGGAPPTAAADESPAGLQWQKLNLEKTLQEQITRAVVAQTHAEQVFVRVEISIPEKAVRPQTNLVGSLSLGKLDLMAPTPPSQLPSLNDNLFGLINRVAIDVATDRSLPDTDKKAIESATRSVVKSATLREPVYTYSALPAAPKLKIETDFKQGLLALALVIGALFVAAPLFWLLRAYRQIEAKKLQAGPIAATGAMRDWSGGGSEPVAKSSRGSNPLSADAAFSQQRIRSLSTASPKRLRSLIRRWLAEGGTLAHEAVMALPHLMDMDVLLPIIEELDDTARAEWRKLLTDPSTSFDLGEAQEFVLQQLLDEVLKKSVPMADEIRTLLDSIRPEECAKIAQNDPELGAVLANLMSTPQVARMFSLLPAKFVHQIANRSLSVSPSDVSNRLPALQKALSQHRSDAVALASPFFERVVDLIREVGPEQEGEIFAALKESSLAPQLSEVAFRICPVEVILKAPGQLHRLCLEQFPIASRADLLFSLSKDQQAILLSAFSQQEKVFEFLEAEFSEIERDETRRRRIERDAFKMWQSYVQTFRRLTHADVDHMSTLEKQIKEWAANFKRGGLHAA